MISALAEFLSIDCARRGVPFMAIDKIDRTDRRPRSPKGPTQFFPRKLHYSVESSSLPADTSAIYIPGRNRFPSSSRYFDFRDDVVDRNFLNSNHVGRLSLAPFSWNRDRFSPDTLADCGDSAWRADNETAFTLRVRSIAQSRIGNSRNHRLSGRDNQLERDRQGHRESSGAPITRRKIDATTGRSKYIHGPIDG